MIVGYARVSTLKQAVKGTSLEEQAAQLKAAGAERIVSDTYTGTTMDRPELTKLLGELKAGDTLIVTKLDRLARTAVDGGAIVRDLHQRGVTINILNLGIADDTPMGRLMVTMLLGFAEFERDLIYERTQSGRAAARANGVRVDGRPPKYSRDQRKLAMDLLAQGNSYTQVERMTGISRSTLVREHRKVIASS